MACDRWVAVSGSTWEGDWAVPVHESVTESQSEQPLLGAILELRKAVVRLVEEQKARVLSRAETHDLGAPASASLPNDQVSAVDEPRPQPVPLPVAADESQLAPAPRRWVPEPPRPAPKEIAAEPVVVTAGAVKPSAAQAEPQAPDEVGTDGASRPEDPRQRLDALARLLDKRAKHTTGRPPDQGARTDES
jgi:hypothetical protein